MKKNSAIYMRALAGLMALTSAVQPSFAGSSYGSPFESKAAREMGSDEVAKYSSSGRMQVQNAKLITDNYTAFLSKLDIVKKAQRELSMSYYIYSDDSSSSMFNQEVIAAAQRGVKVTLLVDFITNYEHIDLYRFLEREGNKGKGSLKVYFYGLPAKGVLETAKYQAISCSAQAQSSTSDGDACENEKKQKLASLSNYETTWFSRMWLTGMYGKNQTLIGVATEMGGQVDIKALKAGAGSNVSKEDAKKMAKLGYNAKVKNDFGSKFKLAMALSAYGSVLGPMMNQVMGVTPVAALQGPAKDDMDHFTDYTHHKLIVADGQRFQLGGRNIENSYHTDNYSDKYTFIDTDFYAESSEAARVQKAFDNLVSFKAMVGDLKDVDRLVPNEYDQNTQAFGVAFQTCLQGSLVGDLEKCVNEGMTKVPGYKSPTARMDAIAAATKAGAEKFQQYPNKAYSFNWNPKGNAIIDANAEVYYLENTSYAKSNPSKRFYGSQIGAEHEYGKDIHAAWVRGIENTCAVAAKTGQQKRIVLHSAYFYMSSNLVNAIGNALNGTWDCHNVSIEIITNSFPTTDLNVINMFARYQMRSLMKFNWAYADQGRKAKLSYYEYLPHSPKFDGSIPKSLHTKLSVLGDDIIVGSANSDVRSYAMDTNNAVMIRNAPNLVRDYLTFVDKLKNPNSGDLYKMWEAGVILPDPTSIQVVKDPKSGLDVVNLPAIKFLPPIGYASITDEQLDFHNKFLIVGLQMRWDPKKEHLTDAKQLEIKALVNRLGKKIEKSTMKILSHRDSDGKVLSSEELEKVSNEFDNDWKTL